MEMPSIFILLLALIGSMARAEVIELPSGAVVYERPTPEARVLARLKSGSKVSIGGRNIGGFRKVRFKRSGRLVEGYVLSEALQTPDIDPPSLGWGGGMMLSNLAQAGKSFSTQDQVTYTTSNYSSQAVFPALHLQWGLDTGFWRFSAFQRTVHFKTSAKTDVIGASDLPVIVEHKFFSASVQKAWPLFTKFYYGVGLEFSKASSTKVTLSGRDLQTSDEDMPVYMGVQALSGFQSLIMGRFSFFAEAHILAIANQSPMIFGYEAVAGLLYWP